MTNLEGAFDATLMMEKRFDLAGIKSMLLTILDSLLTNRFSRNLVKGYVSEWFESNYGLPQGALLHFLPPPPSPPKVRVRVTVSIKLHF